MLAMCESSRCVLTRRELMWVSVASVVRLGRYPGARIRASSASATAWSFLQSSSTLWFTVALTSSPKKRPSSARLCAARVGTTRAGKRPSQRSSSKPLDSPTPSKRPSPTSRPNRLRALWASWTCALESDKWRFGIKSFRWMSAAMLLEAMAQYEQLESPRSPSRSNPNSPIIPSSNPPRDRPPPLSFMPVKTRLPRKVAKAKKRVDLMSQARYYASELSRPSLFVSSSGG